MEPQMGIEPTSQPWQGRVLTIVLLRHIVYASNIIKQLISIASINLKKMKKILIKPKQFNLHIVVKIKNC